MAHPLAGRIKRALKRIPWVRRAWNGAKARLAYRIVLARPIDPGALEQWQRILRLEENGFIPLVGSLAASPEFQQLLQRAPAADALPWHYLHVLHQGRRQLVQSLPAARTIVDLGGACPQDRRGSLIYMGYPHPFEQLTIVDLPPGASVEQRGASAVAEEIDTGRGRVRYLYRHMRDVTAMAPPAGGIDLLWLGQSLEHIAEAEFDAILRWARSNLAAGGLLACDTPNRRVTRLQSPDAFIHEDHQREYEHGELAAKFLSAGFAIERQGGIGLCRRSLARGRFNAEEIVVHPGLNDQAADSYLMFFFLRPSV